MIKKICPDCQEPFNAGHPFAVCEPCAQRESDEIDAQQEAEFDQRVAFLMNEAERQADRAAYHLSFAA